jgi:hypothetical protein
VDEVVDQAAFGHRLVEAVGGEPAADGVRSGGGRVGRAEQPAQPWRGVEPIAEGDGCLPADVDAPQFGGHIPAELRGQRQDVGVVREDLLLGGEDAADVDHLEFLFDGGQDRAEQVTGQAVGFEQDHRPPAPAVGVHGIPIRSGQRAAISHRLPAVRAAVMSAVTGSPVSRICR